MAVFRNSAMNTMAIVNTSIAQSRAVSFNHNPRINTVIATAVCIQALCWVLSTYHQPRKACPNAAMRERMKDLMVMVINTCCDALSLLANLDITQPKSFQHLCLRFPHASFFLRFCVIVTQQM